MRLLDSMLRALVHGSGVDTRWLKEQLRAQGVTVPLSHGCLEALTRHADEAAWRHVPRNRHAAEPYLQCFRRELAEHAHFVYRWTRTDEKFDPGDSMWQDHVRIARQFALPRPWKLPEMVASECRRRLPRTYLRWAS